MSLFRLYFLLFDYPNSLSNSITRNQLLFYYQQVNITLEFSSQYLLFEIIQPYFIRRTKKFIEKANFLIFSSIFACILLKSSIFSIMIIDIFLFLPFFLVFLWIQTYHKSISYFICFLVMKLFQYNEEFKKDIKEEMLRLNFIDEELIVYTPTYMFDPAKNEDGSENIYYYDKPTYLSDWWAKFKLALKKKL